MAHFEIVARDPQRFHTPAFSSRVHLPAPAVSLDLQPALHASRFIILAGMRHRTDAPAFPLYRLRGEWWVASSEFKVIGRHGKRTLLLRENVIRRIVAWQEEASGWLHGGAKQSSPARWPRTATQMSTILACMLLAELEPYPHTRYRRCSHFLQKVGASLHLPWL